MRDRTSPLRLAYWTRNTRSFVSRAKAMNATARAASCSQPASSLQRSVEQSALKFRRLHLEHAHRAREIRPDRILLPRCLGRLTGTT